MKTDTTAFVTLGDTFQPDDASSIATSATERNWNTVWAQAAVVPHESELPVAQAVRIDGETLEQGAVDTTMTVAQGAKTTVVETDSSGSSCQRYNFMVLSIGYSFMICVVAAAFGTELASVSIYMIGVGFYQVSEKLKSCGCLALPFRPLFVILSMLHLAIDLLVFSIGIFVAELFTWVGAGLCVLFGGISAGRIWHQHIRKVCHLARWAFRGFHADWEPKRLQLFHRASDENSSDVNGGETQVVTWDGPVKVDHEPTPYHQSEGNQVTIDPEKQEYH